MFALYNPTRGCIFKQITPGFFDEDVLRLSCKCNVCKRADPESFETIIANAYEPVAGCIFDQFDFEFPKTAELKSVCFCLTCKGLPMKNVIDYYRTMYCPHKCFKKTFFKAASITEQGWVKICQSICKCLDCQVDKCVR